ncbi:MAG: hypothetical protein ACK4IT_02780 [Thioalkalivibrionaceae bacterium]
MVDQTTSVHASTSAAPKPDETNARTRSSAPAVQSTALEEALLRLFSVASAEQGRVDAATADALAVFNAALDDLAARLRVRHVGPAVGMADMKAESVYRIVVDAHRLDVGEPRWAVWVCDATEHAAMRATWPLGGVARLRMRQVIAALPDLMQGWSAAVQAASYPVDAAARGELARLTARCCAGT